MKTLTEVRVALLRRISAAFEKLADRYPHAAAGCPNCLPAAIEAAADVERGLDCLKALSAIEAEAAGE